MSVFKHKKKLIISLILTLVVAFSFVGCSENRGEQLTEEEKNYRQALEFIEEGNYNDALITFKKIYTYKDSSDYIKRFTVSYDKHTIVNKDNEIVYNFKFDKNGNCINETSVQDLSGKLYEYEYNYEYDSDGNLIKKTQINGLYEEDFYTMEYFYENGKCVKETRATRGSDYVKTTEYIYDEKGNIAEAVVDGSVVEYFYDDNGNQIKAKFATGGFNESSYDVYGNLIAKVSTTENGRKEKFEYEYDEFGNNNETIYTAMDGIKTTYYESYDEYGNLITHIAKNASGDITSKATHSYEGIRVSFR